MTRTACLVWLSAAALCAAAPASRSELSFEVPAAHEDCVYVDLDAGDVLNTTVLVYRGGHLDINLRVTDLGGAGGGRPEVVLYNEMIYSAIGPDGDLVDAIIKKGPSLTAPAEGGYAVCLDNRGSRWTSKVLTLELAVTPAVNGGSGSPASPGATVDVMQALVTRMKHTLEGVSSTQLYGYHREQRHRRTVESTNSRVKLWAAVETGVLCVIVVGQVMLMKSWFKRPIGWEWW